MADRDLGESVETAPPGTAGADRGAVTAVESTAGWRRAVWAADCVARLSGALGRLARAAPLLGLGLGVAIPLAQGGQPETALFCGVGLAILGTMIRDTFGAMFCRVHDGYERLDRAAGWREQVRDFTERLREEQRREGEARGLEGPAPLTKWLILRVTVREAGGIALAAVRDRVRSALIGAAWGAVLFGAAGGLGGWMAWGWVGAAAGAATGVAAGAVAGAWWRVTVA